jgi:hypothetical protein
MRVFGWRGSILCWGWTGWKLLMQCGPGRTLRIDPVHLAALPSWASANSLSQWREPIQGPAVAEIEVSPESCALW